MGKIYCVTGKAEKFFDDVRKALLKWSESEQKITFADNPEDERYNLYINDYLITADTNKYSELIGQYGEDSVLPIYLNMGEEDESELMQLGIFKTYNVSDFKNCMREIVETEFNSYKESRFEFAIPYDETEETEPGQTGTELSERKEDISLQKRKSLLTHLGVFFKAHKKIVLSVTAAILCLAASLILVITLIGKANSIYANSDFDIFVGSEGSTYIVNTNGDVYTFKDCSRCSLIKSLDRETAIVITDYNELYFLKKGEYIKLADDVAAAEISNYSDFVYYISSENVLYKYNLKNKSADKLDDLEVYEMNTFKMIISPDGKRLALSSDFYKYIYDEKGNKEELHSIERICGISDKGTIYAVSNTDGFVRMETGDEGYTFELLTYEPLERIIFNKDYSEVIFFPSISSYIYTESKPCIYTDDGKSYMLNARINTIDNSDGNVKIKYMQDEISIINTKTFREGFFVEQNDFTGILYKLNGNYELKRIDIPDEEGNVSYMAQSNDLYCRWYIYDDNSELIKQKLYKVSKSGKFKLIFENERVDILGITKSDAVYYCDSERNIYYNKNFKTGKINNIEFASFNGVDADTDTIYFIENNKLYYSTKGKNAVMLMENTDSGISYIFKQPTGMYYAYDNNGVQSVQRLYRINKVNELELIYDTEVTEQTDN